MPTEPDLEELALLLENPRLPRQKEIASAVGVDQGFISRVRNRQVKRVTKRILRLANYVKMYPGPDKHVQRAVEDYLAHGGDPGLLVKQVALLKAAQRIEN